MNPVSAVTEDLHRKLGLTDDELDRIRAILGRDPNHAEMAMYSVMWSEHCSYKSSRIHLKDLPSTGPRILIGPGEGAGVIEVDGVAVALRLESHNHPSYVEPVQGAATGIGGIVRDVLSMGARPIALLDPLRFGPLPADPASPEEVRERNRFLVEGVVSGISSYGNCIGVPTVGGEIKFEECYSGNPLVNVMCIGVAPVDRIMLARAHGPGNQVILMGSSTGRDGIGGVSVLASQTFGESDQDKRPSVQVGDPFTEKLLIEACLSLIEKGLVVGIQDLGGAGLCCATSESAAKAGTGMRIDLDRVHRREQHMEPFELLTSESQERMLVVVTPENVKECLEECKRFGLPAEVVGEVTDSGMLEVFEGGVQVADVPAASLGDGPMYDRPKQRPSWIDALNVGVEAPAPDDLASAVLNMISSPNIASKKWAWEQYDHQVMLGTVVRPGHDGAVLRLAGTDTKIAVATDGNGRYCYLDPYLGAIHSVAEAFRNVCALGAEPVAITNCLNFGSPERPEVMWQFAEVIRGMSEACLKLGTPVTGGNVSFYNESSETSIYPTPVIGMVGILPPGFAPVPFGFTTPGDHVFLIGITKNELGGSEYLRNTVGVLGPIPALDLKAESAAGECVQRLVRAGIVSSVHDCSEGGLAVALGESCVAGTMGAKISPEKGLQPFEWLFAESASRYLISVPEGQIPDLRLIADEFDVPLAELGLVGGDSLELEGVFTISIDELVGAYEQGFPSAMGYPS